MCVGGHQPPSAEAGSVVCFRRGVTNAETPERVNASSPLRKAVARFLAGATLGRKTFTWKGIAQESLVTSVACRTDDHNNARPPHHVPTLPDVIHNIGVPSPAVSTVRRLWIGAPVAAGHGRSPRSCPRAGNCPRPVVRCSRETSHRS